MASQNPLKESDGTLIRLSETIRDSLQNYLPEEFSDAVANRIRFGMFDKDNPPDYPTVYVFLYDVQEELELRHGQPRHYKMPGETLAPRYVHVRCCYLLTYWEPEYEEPEYAVKSQQNLVNNMALNALLNLKLDLPSAFVRVIAPSEHLSSLGSFWQSVGDKPRLCLTFTVTVPIALDNEGEEKVPRVVSTELKEATASWEREDLALTFKRELLTSVLSEWNNTKDKKSEADWRAARTKLARLQVSCDYMDKESERKVPEICVAGVLDAPLHTVVIQTIKTLAVKEKWKKGATVNYDAVYEVPTKEAL